ncbi:MAG: hypothetical protein PHU64_06455 [Candidatus Omnitrophica bacterium]|nr:hypothetical protein [Candidatus Omnitrophota bacterium]MDD5429881.1 hypothetical protein [Candidatus Omnitrophota bacterium]
MQGTLILDKIIKISKYPVLFILFCYLVLFACYNLGGADYLFHIKSGQVIVEEKQLPSTDIFSFIKNSKTWNNHEWLYQIGLYYIYENFGLQGMFLLKIIIFSLAFFLLACIALRVDWVFSFPLLFYGLQISLRRFTLRPDNLSFLFFILFLLPFVFKKRRLLFLLPLVQILWVNIHGFFFIGPAVLAIYLLLAPAADKNGGRKFYNGAKLSFIFCILACFVTPHPRLMFQYPFMVIKDIVSGNQKLFYQFIQELSSPLASAKNNYIFLVYITAGLGFLIFTRKRNWFYIGLFSAIAVFSLNSLRNMYFIVPVTIAVFVNCYPHIKESFLKLFLKEKGFFLLKVIFFIFTVFISFKTFGTIRHLPDKKIDYLTKDNKVVSEGLFLARDPQGYPAQMLKFIGKTPLPKKMFNTFNLGAMLIFNFYPERQVFIDGRTEFYGQEFFSLYRKISEGNSQAIEQAVSEYGLRGFMISYFKDKPPFLIRSLRGKNFSCVYFGVDGIIFVDKNFIEENPSLKSKEIDFNKVEFGSLDMLKDIKCSRPFLKGKFNMAYVLYLLGYYEQSRQYLAKIIEINPVHPQSYYLLGEISYKAKDYEKAFVYCRDSLLLDSSLREAEILLAKIYFKTGNIKGAKTVTKSLKIDFEKFSKGVENE